MFNKVNCTLEIHIFVQVQQAFAQKVKNGPVEVPYSEPLVLRLITYIITQIDLMHWMTRLSLELIGQSGLGYSFDDLTENAIPHRYAEVSKLLT